MSVNMVRTAALIPLVAPYATNCPDFLIEQAIRLAAIDLAERSRAWRHVVSVPVSGGYSSILTGNFDGVEYPLIFVTGGLEFEATAGSDATTDMSGLARTASVIHEIEFAEFDGRKLDPVQFTTLKDVMEGQPRYITQATPNVISLIPFRPGKLDISVFLKPASLIEFGQVPADPLFDRNNVLPEFFITVYGNRLAYGALSRLLAMKDQFWTDLREAGRYFGMFEQALNESFRANMRGQQRAKIRTPFRDF